MVVLVEEEEGVLAVEVVVMVAVVAVQTVWRRVTACRCSARGAVSSETDPRARQVRSLGCGTPSARQHACRADGVARESELDEPLRRRRRSQPYSNHIKMQ